VVERDRDRIAQMLTDSARAVRDAVKNRVEADRAMTNEEAGPVTWGVWMRKK
jgi:uncharacterized protein with beta-barrel porin domain